MISFVYFDLGGVVVKDFTSTNKWEEFVSELKIPKENVAEFETYFNEIEPDLCRGKNIESLLSEIKQKFLANPPENYSLLNGFVKRFEKNESIWPVVNSFGEKFRIGLLTNMYPGMLDSIKERGLMPDTNWEMVVDSSMVGFQKPDKEIYDFAVEKAGVLPEEILFIDNSKSNLEGAKNSGLGTYFYDSSDYIKSSEELLSFLKKLNIEEFTKIGETD